MAEFIPIQRLTPIDRIDRVFGQSGAQETEKSSGIFKDLFDTAMNNVSETDNASVNDSEKLAVGDVDDLHTLSINNMKSYLAVSSLIQMRNRALESYNQIMQITV